MTTRIRKALKRRASGESGFTLIEVIVAMVITALVMAALGTVLVSSLRTVSLARQRQTATSLATQALESLRALPYNVVTLASTTTVASPNPYLTPSGTGYLFTPPAALLSGVSEAIVPGLARPTGSGSGQWQDISVSNVSYRVYTYVTRSSAAGQQAFNVYAITAWSSAVTTGQNSVIEQSTLYSPSGCLGLGNHPYSGPCQAIYTAHAGQVLGGFQIIGEDSTIDVPGFDGRQLALDPALLSTALSLEQTATVTGTVQTGAARATGASVTTTGGIGAPIAVDSDPSSPLTQQTASATQSSSVGAATLGPATGFPWQLASRPEGGYTASVSGGIYADPNLCKDGTLAATGLVTGPIGAPRPCASAVVPNSTSGGYLALQVVGPGGPSVQIATVASAPSPSRAVAANLAVPNTGVACDASTPAIVSGSCVHAAAKRYVGRTTVADPTGATAPPGYQGLWYVDGLNESVLAESGLGARTPGYSRGGDLYVWNGSSYDHVALGAAASGTFPAAPAISTVTLTYPGGLTVTASGTVTVNAGSTATAGPATCTTLCTATAGGSSVVTAQTTFVVTYGAFTTTFVLVSDLGALQADTAFKAAPNG